MLRVGTGGMRAGSVCSAATARMPDDMIGSSEPEGLSIGTGDGVREIAGGIGGGIVEPDGECDSGGGVGVPTRARAGSRPSRVLPGVSAGACGSSRGDGPLSITRPWGRT